MSDLARRYVRVLGALLVLQGLGGLVVKLVQERGSDLPHTALHLLSGLVALWVSAPRRADGLARRFAAAFGALYLALGVVGAAHAPTATPLRLEVADHVFHIVVGAVTLAVGLRSGGASSRRPASSATTT